MIDFQLQRTSKKLVVEQLPDGSTAIFEPATKAVHSLNPLAAAVFGACREQISLAGLVEAVGSPDSVEPVLAAITDLEAAGLVERSSAESTSRRGMLKAAAAIAIPAVLTLTAAEQSAYALQAGSGEPQT